MLLDSCNCANFIDYSFSLWAHKLPSQFPPCSFEALNKAREKIHGNANHEGNVKQLSWLKNEILV